jgi:hypothetical protein
MSYVAAAMSATVNYIGSRALHQGQSFVRRAARLEKFGKLWIA